MAVAMLIGLWIYDELSFDKYHHNYDRLAQVMQHQTFNGTKGTQNSIPRPLEFALRNTYGSDFPYLSMASWTGDHILTFGEQKISKIGNYFQEDFPEMISLKMIKGTRKGLKDPTSVLLSESTAKALFGESEPINQSIRIDNKADVKVTGVYEDLPFNTQFKDMEFIASWELYITQESWVKRALDQWDNNSFQLFAQIPPNTDMEKQSGKIKMVKYVHAGKDSVFRPEIFLFPMSDWHLRSDWKEGKNRGGRIQMVWLFGIIGVFVLLLACINFMNLSTARSEKRAKEVGIRMTIGSVRSQLINQFMSESFLVVVMSFVLAVGLVLISLSWFNTLADKKIIIAWTNPWFWSASLIFILVTSLLAGSYPALYLSSFQPVNVLKGAFKLGRFASLPRKVLVVVQFTVSVTLIIGTIIVYQQIQFSKNRPIGYDREGLVMIPMKSPDFYGKFDVLRTELKRTGAIEELSESSSPLTEVWSDSGGFDWKGKDPALQTNFATIWVTHEYGKTVNWKIKEGRDFSREFATDSMAILINEAGVKFMGVKDPVGMEINWFNGKLHVIGVVKDLLMQSPYSPVKQTVYLLDNGNVNWINLKLNPKKSAHESITLIESAFKKYIPSAPFDYRFVNEEYAKKFASEERVGRLSSIFATLAILISCLGLFGLASFVAEQRTKEIGIRKVLGASVANLWRMLSKDFVLLVIISCLIAIPAAYYFLESWLKKYEYRTEISWWIFMMAGTGALVITLLTVSYQAIKAALMNPVNSLRSE
jgi:ABC-type antimicrobial peptide transport system permease subunit